MSFLRNVCSPNNDISSDPLKAYFDLPDNQIIKDEKNNTYIKKVSRDIIYRVNFSSEYPAYDKIKRTVTPFSMILMRCRAFHTYTCTEPNQNEKNNFLEEINELQSASMKIQKSRPMV